MFVGYFDHGSKEPYTLKALNLTIYICTHIITAKEVLTQTLDLIREQIKGRGRMGQGPTISILPTIGGIVPGQAIRTPPSQSILLSCHERPQ